MENRLGSWPPCWIGHARLQAQLKSFVFRSRFIWTFQSFESRVQNWAPNRERAIDLDKTPLRLPRSRDSILDYHWKRSFKIRELGNCISRGQILDNLEMVHQHNPSRTGKYYLHKLSQFGISISRRGGCWRGYGRSEHPGWTSC